MKSEVSSERSSLESKSLGSGFSSEENSRFQAPDSRPGLPTSDSRLPTVLLIYSATLSPRQSYEQPGKSASLHRWIQAMALNDRHRNSTSCRILVVENSDDFRAGRARELQGIGHRVTVAGERSDALAQEEGEPFDMLISDLISPAQDGRGKA